MKQYTFLLALVVLTWVGCGTEASETTGPIPANNNTSVPALQSLSDTSNRGNTISPIETNAQPGTVVPTSQSTAGLNPPHGQPGHRCDIQVGQPLNSAPIQATIPPQPQQISTSPQQISTSPQPLSAPSGAGINPAHGQPGHRCDIAVGAPLK